MLPKSPSRGTRTVTVLIEGFTVNAHCAPLQCSIMTLGQDSGHLQNCSSCWMFPVCSGFPLPPEVPPSPFTSGSGHPGGSYDSRCAPYFPFAAGVYPHTLGPMNPWLGVSDHAKAWNYHSSQDNPRERVKDRERTRERERAREPKKEQERERDQENTLAFPSRSSDKERASRHRDHSVRESDRQREHEREREREDRRRERRHRERNERHKSSRSSSSWRKHSIDDGESHRRHRLKRSKCNKDSTDTGSTE
ncbi:pre-mRNA 3'-end-processing factor FIP1 isoform X2 [Silurus meridionalis]|nr:pre-mRNA 3'-end-processing factor FIP1 isoform X2 [Silurus meridionalis]